MSTYRFMKSLLRYFLINLVSLWATSEILKGGLIYIGGFQTLLLASAVFAGINFVLIPLLKILLLPLNLLTLGIFAWMTNVIALYALTTVVPQIKLSGFYFPGWQNSGFTIPAVDLTTFWVAVVASLLIGLFTHFLQWLTH